MNPPVDVAFCPSGLVATTSVAPTTCAGVVAVITVELAITTLAAEVPPIVIPGNALYAAAGGVKFDDQRAIPLDTRNSSIYPGNEYTP